MRISFGPFAFDPQSRLLWRDGAEIALPPRVLGVLELLIERPGQIVARQELLDRVWKDAFVTDTSLAEAVSYLRQALGDDPQSPRYIQTVHRRGYRFLPAVRGLTPDVPGAAADRGLTPDGRFAGASGDRLASRSYEAAPSVAALVTAGVLGIILWRSTNPIVPDGPPVARFEVRLPDGTRFGPSSPALTVSSDGRQLAWAACETASGGCAIYVRPIDRLEAARLAGTEEAVAPVFSPDGRWLAFFADGKLKKISVSGGTSSTLADAPSPGGAAWTSGGRIVFGGSAAGGLWLVDEQGGSPRALTTPRMERGEVRHVNPSWLPGGGIVFTIVSSPMADGPGELAALGPNHGTPTILRSGVARAVPTGRGYLVLSTGRDLQAATFDERSLALTGRADSVLTEAGPSGVLQFAVGGDGTLALVRAPDDVPTLLARMSAIVLSPDTRRAAGVIADGSGADVWVATLAAATMTRVTFGGTSASPAWSADGKRIYFATRDGARPYALVSKALDGGERVATPIATEGPAFPTSVAADGRIAVTTIKDGRTAAAILTPGSAAPHVLTDGPFDETAGVFSPDGRWLALESAESGRAEIVVRDTRGAGRMVVSTGGGTRPRWSGDGRAIYFESGRRLMRASFHAEPGSRASATDVVFDGVDGRVVAVTPSGQVITQPRREAAAVLVVLQWLRELQQRLPLPVPSPR